MRIVNREVFLAQPAGTVFSKYKPCIFGELLIKGESLISETNNDFYYQPIVDAIDSHSSEEFLELLESADKFDNTLRMNFNIENRDGLFEDEQLFAIWSTADVKALINRLQQAVNR